MASESFPIKVPTANWPEPVDTKKTYFKSIWSTTWAQLQLAGEFDLTAPTAGNVHLSTAFPYLFQVAQLFVWFAKHLSLLLCSFEHK